MPPVSELMKMRAVTCVFTGMKKKAQFIQGTECYFELSEQKTVEERISWGMKKGDVKLNFIGSHTMTQVGIIQATVHFPIEIYSALKVKEMSLAAKRRLATEEVIPLLSRN